MKIVDALATGSLPIIITEPEDGVFQTVAPDIVVQTGKDEPWLYYMIALVIVVLILVAIVYVIGRSKGSHKCEKEKKRSRSLDRTPQGIETGELAEEYHFSQNEELTSNTQISVPDRNNQVYPEILLVNLDQPDVLYRTNISEHVIIGRREGSDIRITTDNAVSNRHCMISVKGTQFYLEDCNSTNGTRYNDQEVTAQIPILSGGILEIGHARYRLVIAS